MPIVLSVAFALASLPYPVCLETNGSAIRIPKIRAATPFGGVLRCFDLELWSKTFSPRFQAV